MNGTLAWLVSILAAALPTAAYVLVLWWFDRYEKEPKRLLIAAFVWGAAPAVILSVLAETVLRAPFGSLSEQASDVMSSSVLAPAVEELVKGLAVFALFLRWRHEFDGVLDGIIYGATVGFGFGMTENALYFVRSLQLRGWQGLTLTVFLRSVVFGLNHALFTSVFGAALGYTRMARAGRLRWFVPLLGLLGAMLLHAVHNLFAMLARITCFSLLVSLVSDWGGVLVLFAVMALAWQQEKRWIAAHLQAEVASGLLSEEEYEMIRSYRSRIAAQWRAWSSDGLGEVRRLGRLAQLATELAFKLEQGDERVAAGLRQQIAAARGEQATTEPLHAAKVSEEEQNQG